jgi:radical SAM superfamily enzyme YgiQ (UPF0313 family)
MNIQLCQLNNSYGNQVYIPYAVGILQVEAKKRLIIKENVNFSELLYKREKPESILARIKIPDVLGLSCYIWNWRISLELARQFKKINPNGIVIIGGPQVPDEILPVFLANSFIDYAVHGEAEETFPDLIEFLLNKKNINDIKGVSLNAGKNTIKFTPRPRKRNLDEYTSPYLQKEFDQLITDHPNEKWMALWETNRGCPFSCTFCDWGMATGSKVVEFPIEKLENEIEWFSEKQIEFVFGCDANFGIRSRDIEIAKKLTASKKNTGYPKDFRVCFTKNSTHKIFDLATIFNDSGMLKGVSLSMQSLNEKALNFIKRDNIKLSTFEDLQKKYSNSNISTYTELIIGLPGETYESFVDGLCTLLERGQHHQILVYNLSVMPNSEMGNETYQKLHGIVTIDSPIFQAHSSSNSQTDDIIEYEPIIISTNDMNLEDWKKSYKFSWVIQCFHTLGLTQSMAIFFRNYSNISYKNFYMFLLNFCEVNKSLNLSKELNNVDIILNKALNGKGFGQTIEEFSDIVWPIEEASYLRISNNIDIIFSELKYFIESLLIANKLEINDNLIKDLINFQFAEVATHLKGDNFINLKYDIPEYIKAIKENNKIELNHSEFIYEIINRNEYLNKKKEFAREIVWYGRKGGRFNRKLVKINNTDSSSKRNAL